MFGDSELFAEFEKEREPSGSFILYETNEEGDEDRSKFVFQMSESSSSEESDEDEQKLKVKEQSVAYTVENLQKENARQISPTSKTSEELPEQNGLDSDSESESEQEETAVVSKERTDKMTSYKLNFERILSFYF